MKLPIGSEWGRALVLVSLIWTLSAGNVSADALQMQLDAQQRTMLQIQNELGALRQEVANLRGEIEELRHQNTTSAADTAPASASVRSVGPAPITEAPPAPQATVATKSAAEPAAGTDMTVSPADSGLKDGGDAARTEYEAAYQKIVSNDLNGAIVAFGSYLKKYPDVSLTPNAWYWLAQAQYKKELYDDARVSFLNVAQYKQSQKRPDAIYKLGLIKKKQGDLETAHKFFTLVVKQYPNDTSAKLAEKELSEDQSAQ